MNHDFSTNLRFAIAFAFLGTNLLGCASSEAQPPNPPRAVPTESVRTIARPSRYDEKSELPAVKHTPDETIKNPVNTRVVIEEHVRTSADGTETREQIPRIVTENVDHRVLNSPPGFVAPLQLNSDIQLVLNKYKSTEDPKLKEQAIETLTKLSTEQFDAFQKQREEELKSLEEKVKKLRELHDRREKEKQEIVAERVRGLLRNADGMGWGEAMPLAPNTFMSGSNVPVPSRRLPIPPSTFKRTEEKGTPSQPLLPPGQPTLAPPSTPTIKIFKLKHANAKDLSALLSTLLASPNKDLKIQSDVRTNSIIASGQPADFEKIEELLNQLDQQSEPSAFPGTTNRR